jgi:hypothetical protein
MWPKVSADDTHSPLLPYIAIALLAVHFLRGLWDRYRHRNEHNANDLGDGFPERNPWEFPEKKNWGSLSRTTQMAPLTYPRRATSLSKVHRMPRPSQIELCGLGSSTWFPPASPP